MVALNTAYAAPKNAADPKNRVGDFFYEDRASVGKNRWASRLNTQEKYSYHYETASGRSNGSNRDPMQEQGGLNLYVFVKNDGVDLWDNFGLKSCTSKRIDINLGRKEYQIGTGKITFKVQLRGTAKACDDCTKSLSASLTGAVGSDIPVVSPFIITISGNVNGQVEATFDATNNLSDVSGNLIVKGWIGGGVSAGIGKAVAEGGLSASWSAAGGDINENEVSFSLIGEELDFNARLRVTVAFGNWEYNAIPYEYSTSLVTPPNFDGRVPLPGFP